MIHFSDKNCHYFLSLPPHFLLKEISCPYWPFCLEFWSFIASDFGIFNWVFLISGFCVPCLMFGEPSQLFLKFGPPSKIKFELAEFELRGQIEDLDCTVEVVSCSVLKQLSSSLVITILDTGINFPSSRAKQFIL